MSELAGLERSLKAGRYSDSLFRNNIVSVAPSPSVDWNIVQPDEVVLARAHARAGFTGNTYPQRRVAAAPMRYAAEEGADVPRLVLPYRVLRLRGPQGSTLTGNIPVYNAGIKTSSWSASAPAWLGVTAANRTLTAESTIGRLTVAVNTSGLTRGTHVGKNPSSDGTRGTDRHRSSRRRVTVRSVLRLPTVRPQLCSRA